MPATSCSPWAPDTATLGGWFGSLADLVPASRLHDLNAPTARFGDALPSLSALAAAQPTLRRLLTPLATWAAADQWPTAKPRHRAVVPAPQIRTTLGVAASRPTRTHAALERDLADVLVTRIRADDYDTIAALAREYRPALERLRLVRPDSRPAAALRRLQTFLAAHVYGSRIPEPELPPRIRRGRATGGRRLVRGDNCPAS